MLLATPTEPQPNCNFEDPKTVRLGEPGAGAVSDAPIPSGMVDVGSGIAFAESTERKDATADEVQVKMLIEELETEAPDEMSEDSLIKLLQGSNRGSSLSSLTSSSRCRFSRPCARPGGRFRCASGAATYQTRVATRCRSRAIWRGRAAQRCALLRAARSCSHRTPSG